MSAEEKHHVASAKWCGYSTNLKPTRHYRAVIQQVQWAPSSGREVPCGIIIFFLFLFLNYLIGLLNFILCLYSQVGMFWLENTIGNLERYFPRKCFRINSSNLNFTHMKASLFRLSQFLLYKKFFSPVIILLPNKYFPVLANLGWVLHLYSFTQTLLTSRGPGLVPEPRNQVSAAVISAFANSFPMAQAVHRLHYLEPGVLHLAFFLSLGDSPLDTYFRTYCSLSKILRPSPNCRASIIYLCHSASPSGKSRFSPDRELCTSVSFSDPLPFFFFWCSYKGHLHVNVAEHLTSICVSSRTSPAFPFVPGSSLPRPRLCTIPSLLITPRCFWVQQSDTRKLSGELFHSRHKIWGSEGGTKPITILIILKAK